MTRRSLVFGASVLGGASAAGLLSACSWVTSAPATPSPDQVETPTDDPGQSTPVPETSDTPDPDPPTPTPTPEPVEQVLRVGGDLVAAVREARDQATGCLRFPSIHAGLVTVNADFEIEADWANIWVPGMAGESWTFQLRQNEQGWVDGSPVTAHDFVSAWRRLLDPERQDPDAWRLFDILNAREVYNGELPPEELGIAAPDDWTLEVGLERPRQSFPALAASPFLTPDVGPAGSDPASCDSNGPYRVAGEEDDTLTLAPNEDYWSPGAAALERIEVATDGPSGSLDQFRNGDLDLLRLAPADVPRARTDSDLSDSLAQASPTRLVCLIPQVDTPPFDDVNVRRALSLMIDRERLELIVEGRVVPARRLIANGLFPPVDSQSSTLNVQLDVDTGLELIAGSAYPDPSEWPELALVIPQGDSYMERVARDLSEQLTENLGVDVPVSLIRQDQFAQGLRERQFPLTWVDWTYRYADPASAYADLFASWLNPERPAVWEDADYDELVRLADSIENPIERAEIYAQCESLLQELGVYAPLVHPIDHYLVQPWVENVPRDSHGRVLRSGPLYTRFATGMEIARRT